MSYKLSLRDASVAVVVLTVMAWFGLRKGAEPAPAPPAKTAAVGVDHALVQTTAADTASIEHRDQDTIDRYRALVTGIQSAYPAGSHCHDDTLADTYHLQGMQQTHDAFFQRFAHDPQGTVEEANRFMREHPILQKPGWTPETVAAAPADFLESDERDFADRSSQLRQQGCLR